MQRKVDVITRLLSKTEADVFFRHVLSHVANALHVLTPTKEESSKYKACNKKSVAVGMQRKVNVVTRLLTKTEADEFFRHVLSHVANALQSSIKGMEIN